MCCRHVSHATVIVATASAGATVADAAVVAAAAAVVAAAHAALYYVRMVHTRLAPPTAELALIEAFKAQASRGLPVMRLCFARLLCCGTAAQTSSHARTRARLMTSTGACVVVLREGFAPYCCMHDDVFIAPSQRLPCVM
jgi:non-ribosomal peptide synthetase component E (peptide arylation enzyme)